MVFSGFAFVCFIFDEHACDNMDGMCGMYMHICACECMSVFFVCVYMCICMSVCLCVHVHAHASIYLVAHHLKQGLSLNLKTTVSAMFS